MLAVSVLISCEEASSGSDNTTESPGAVIATQTPKRAATDVRDSYGIFTIKTGGDTYTDYHLAVKEASATAPTATEMASGALKRNISATEIHVLIAQRMNAPMVTFAEAYFADNTQKTLGTDMTSVFDDDDDGGSVYDATATGADAWVKESVLKPSTEYALYGMPNGGTEVAKLLSFTTDATQARGATGITGIQLQYMDTTLEKDYITISVNPDELYIFPIHHDLATDIAITRFEIRYSKQESTDIVVLSSTMNVFGGLPGSFNAIHLARNLTGASTPDANNGLKAYMLVDTAQFMEDVHFGSTIMISTTLTRTPTLLYSTLSPQ